LYNVTRSSDGATFSVPVLAPGGFANKSAHDEFCPQLDCVISHVLDQSPNGNHLGQRHKRASFNTGGGGSTSATLGACVRYDLSPSPSLFLFQS
jgi:hypothetical protein